MAMLDRYKKTGGFNQLLILLETCGSAKQQKFLEIIRQEDARWADALTAKMIDLTRFLTWSDSAIAEVTGAMMEINVAAIISTMDEAQQTRLMGTLPHIKRRKVQDLLMAQKPSPGEIASSTNKLFETIRRLSQEGVLRMDKVDPPLFIDADIEDRLKQGKDIAGVPTAAESLAKAVASLPAVDNGPETRHLRIVNSIDTNELQNVADTKTAKSHDNEVLLLKRKIQLLQNENISLRQELAIVTSKLDQIRKLS